MPYERIEFHYSRASDLLNVAVVAMFGSFVRRVKKYTIQARVRLFLY
jgi:hypothetical protein